jgi:hypothetical protein
MRLMGSCSRPLRLSFIGFLCGFFLPLGVYLSRNAFVYMLPQIRDNCARLIGRGFDTNLANINVKIPSQNNDRKLLLVGIMVFR